MRTTPAASRSRPSDWYTIRLDQAARTATVQVAILTDGLVDVVVDRRRGVTTLAVELRRSIGGYVPIRLFLGNLAISRRRSDDHARQRQRPRQLRRRGLRAPATRSASTITVGGIAQTYDVEIADTPTAVTEHTIVLTPTTRDRRRVRGHTGTTKADTVSLLTREGWFDGAAAVDTSEHAPRPGRLAIVRTDIPVRTRPAELARPTASSRASGSSCISTAPAAHVRAALQDRDHPRRQRDQGQRSSSSARTIDLDGAFHLVDDLASRRLGHDGDTCVRRIAAVATFDDDQLVRGAARSMLVADVGYAVPISRQGVKVFPVADARALRSCGARSRSRAASPAPTARSTSALKLPGENDGPLFKIGTQPPESKQIDVLNIFNDGSKAGRRRHDDVDDARPASACAKDLDFGPTYSSGNAADVRRAGRSSPAASASAPSSSSTASSRPTARKSTIEVVNLLLGIGNDQLDIQGTIDPDDAVKLTGTIIDSRPARAAGVRRSTSPARSRSTGRRRASSSASRSTSPASPGIVEGRRLLRRRPRPTPSTTRVMHLQPAPGARRRRQLAAARATSHRARSVSSTSRSRGDVRRPARSRAPPASWIADGFVVGQRVTITGLTGSWRVHDDHRTQHDCSPRGRRSAGRLDGRSRAIVDRSCGRVVGGRRRR